MDFQRARSEAEISSRQDEILRSGAVLFAQSGYSGVTFKAIAGLTSFTRPTIYNYYKNKDEVLLALLQRELLTWRSEFAAAIAAAEHMTAADYCRCLARSLEHRADLFRLLAFLSSSMEANSRSENLQSFYRSVLEAFTLIDASLERFFPLVPERARRSFRFQAVSLCLGLHALTSLSDKQAAALETIGAIGEVPDFTSLFSQGVQTLIADMERT